LHHLRDFCFTKCSASEFLCVDHLHIFVTISLSLQIISAHWKVIDLRIIMAMIFLPILAVNSLKSLKVLAPFSTIGKLPIIAFQHESLSTFLAANVMTFIGLGIVLFYVFQGLPPLSEREVIGPINKYPLFFGSALFALEAVGIIIAVERW